MKYKKLTQLQYYLHHKNAWLDLMKKRGVGLDVKAFQDINWFGHDNPTWSPWEGLKRLERRYRAIFKWIDDNQPKTAFEAGCAWGTAAWFIGEICEVHACDTIKTRIDLARHYWGDRVTFYNDYGEELLSRLGKKFDLIYLVSTPADIDILKLYSDNVIKTIKHVWVKDEIQEWTGKNISYNTKIIDKIDSMDVIGVVKSFFTRECVEELSKKL